MNTMYKSSNGTTLVPLDTRLIAERKIFLEGDINSACACDFVKKIMYLTSQSSDKPIHIYISSPGGEVNAGLLIYDTIKGITCEVRMYCIEMAASMAAIILAGGQKGRRYILPHSKVMIHEPLIPGGVGGSATTIKKTAETILETKRLSVELLANDTGKSAEDIEMAISYDNYMNAEEAVSFGICDKIINTLTY